MRVRQPSQLANAESAERHMSRPATVPRTSTDAAINAMAAQQHGVVTRRQLLRAGLSDDVVDVRIGRGLLTRVYRGVFQVGPIVAPRAREMAACLACGSAAFVGHRSAAVLWQLLPPDSLAMKVEIVMRRGIRRHPAIRIRRAGSLRDADVTRLDGIPVTTPARTILDLAASASPRELERAIAEALARRRTTRGVLQSMLAHARGRRGTAALRAWLEGRGPALTRSRQRNDSSPSCAGPDSASPSSTSASPVARWTSCGAPNSSSPKSTASPSTPTRPPSRTTVAATSR